MKYTTGDIWKLAAEMDAWVVVPTNTSIRKDGKAVMGKGVAKDASDRYPGLQDDLGSHIKLWDSRLYVSKPIICLPTKTDWRHPASIELIQNGCNELRLLFGTLRSVGHTNTVLLPRLGCGLGGLNWEKQVRPIVDLLLPTDNFMVVSNE